VSIQRVFRGRNSRKQTNAAMRSAKGMSGGGGRRGSGGGGKGKEKKKKGIFSKPKPKLDADGNPVKLTFEQRAVGIAAHVGAVGVAVMFDALA
jgi:hypothetical protein